MSISGETPHERVDEGQALVHARFAILQGWMRHVPDFAVLETARLAGSWEVDDLNGEPLFYLIPIQVGEQRAGWVRAAASPIVGPPVLAVEAGDSGWDPDDAMGRALERARTQFPATEVSGARLVCYSYPKLGVRVTLSGTGRQSVVFDASSLTEIPRFGADQLEGFTAWSYYATVVEPRLQQRLRIWSQAQAELQAVQRQLGDLLAEDHHPRELAQRLGAGAASALTPTESHIIRYSPRCNTHVCIERYAQQKDNYCAVATGQMILDFYRYRHEQDQIAAAMGTKPNGTPNPGQIAGYGSLSNQGLVASFDCCATWAEAKAELDADRPVKDGIPGHARVLTGYEKTEFLSGPSLLKLRILDPAPSSLDICVPVPVVWEDWNAVPHTNFIYVRHA